MRGQEKTWHKRKYVKPDRSPMSTLSPYLTERTLWHGGVGRAHWRCTRMKNFAAGVRGYLCQARFHSCVPDESHLLAAARYVEQNPVRAGITNVPGDYPWSSARFHLGIPEHDPLVTDRTLLELVEDWERLLRSSDDGRSSTLRKLTRSDRPVGDATFVSRIEQITGRDLSKPNPGRPRKRTA